MNSIKFIFTGLMALMLLPTYAFGTNSTEPTYQHIVIQRDVTYEQNLHFQASADKAITPARVIHWLMGFAGHPTLYAPPRTEIRPLVYVHDSDVRVIAAIAFKF